MTRIPMVLLALFLAHETVELRAQSTSETYAAIVRYDDRTPHGYLAVTIAIDHYTTDAEDATLRTIAKQGWSAIHAALDEMPAVGTIVVDGRRTALKYAYKPPRNGG